MSDTSVSRLSGYHDFGGLASLRGDAAQGETGALRETAKQFEAYFLQTVMKTMREATERSDLMDNREADQFQDLMDKEVAMKMADRGALGLADMIERTMKQRMEAPAAVALSARERLLQPQPGTPMPLAAEPSRGLALPSREPGPLPLKARKYMMGRGDE